MGSYLHKASNWLSRAEGINVSGPFAPDTVFMRARAKHGQPGALVADRTLSVLGDDDSPTRWNQNTCITKTFTPKSITETLALISSTVPPHKTACSPNRSVSVSSRKLVSMMPALPPPLAIA